MSAVVTRFTSEPLSDEVKKAIERIATSDDVAKVAVMPDVHLAHDVCVGTVIATKELIYPEAVGGDLGCGMAAVRIACDAAVLDDEHIAARLLAGMYDRVPALQHAVADAPSLPDALLAAPLSHGSLEKLRAREGRLQCGTLGRGNHFLELQEDREDGGLWLMVHSGSRAMGPAIRDHHRTAATIGARGLSYLVAEEPSGRAYLADLAWALAYADHNRRVIVAAVGSICEDVLGASLDAATFVTCHHNHVRRQDGWWVHRKGAIPAAAGERGIIPGSMGTQSYHTTGRGCAAALWSSSHGAGRKLSRSEARARISRRALSEQMGRVWFDHRRAEQLRDEAPGAYKDIGAVMRAQTELTRIDRVLAPRLSYKGV